MTTLLDEISPDYIGAGLISLKLNDPTTPPRAFNAVIVDVDYSAADEFGGIQNPIELIVSGPSPSSFRREVFGNELGGISQRTPPSSVAFSPQEGGRHLLMIREVGHNRLHGTIEIDVEGSINDPGAGQGQDA